MGKESKIAEEPFRVLVKDCTMGACPAIFEGRDTDDLVVVGRLDAEALNSEAVLRQTGEGEIAVVIPRRLLLRAAKLLR